MMFLNKIAYYINFIEANECETCEGPDHIDAQSIEVRIDWMCFFAERMVF